MGKFDSAHSWKSMTNLPSLIYSPNLFDSWGNLVSPSYIKFQRFPLFLKKFPRFANKINETSILELFEKL